MAVSLRALSILIKFLLYEELGIYPPRDSDEERVSNKQLMRMLGGGQVTVRSAEEILLKRFKLVLYGLNGSPKLT